MPRVQEIQATVSDFNGQFIVKYPKINDTVHHFYTKL